MRENMFSISINRWAQIAILGVLLSACDSPQEPSSTQNADLNRDLLSAKVSQEVTFKNVRDEDLGRISGERLSVNGDEIRYKYGSSGKRKYVNQAGQSLLKIKRSDRNKIKLKAESGVLLWKIKRKPDSIKIADNEEMLKAFKIKFNQAYKAKVLIDEQPLFEVKVDQDTFPTGNSADLMNADNPVSIAIMSLDDIPLLHRLVIIKELAE